jgi:nicotinamidase-related amidase
MRREKMKTALLLIDIQNDYFPGGKMELDGPVEAAKRAAELLQCFRDHAMPTVHIQHISLDPGATFFISGDRGTDIHDICAHFEGEPLVQKHYPNSFHKTNLPDLLIAWEIERVIITGMMTHMCVDATARAAADLGFKVMVAEDACATRALTYGETTIPAEHVHKAFLAALKSYGPVMTVERILAHLAAEQAEALGRGN